MKYSKLHPDFFQGGGYSPVQFSSSQFIPTYAGAPLAEAQRNAEQTAGIYHQNLADLTKIDIMNANRKIIDSDADKAENDKINARLAEQFKNITAKGDMENQTLQVNALLREYMNDPAQKALTESRANADKEAAFQQEARSKGATIVLDNPAEGHQTIQYDEKGRPVYNIYKGTGQIKLNWQGKKAAIADQLKPDSFSTGEITAAKDAIRGYITTGKWEGISGGVDKNGKPIGKVGRLLDDLMVNYQGTQEYTQEKAVAMRELTGQGLSPEAADAEAEQLIRQRMFSEGMTRTFSKSDREHLRDWILEKALDKAPAGIPPTATGETAAGINPLIAQQQSFFDNVDDETGEVNVSPDANILTDKQTGRKLSQKESEAVYAPTVGAGPGAVAMLKEIERKYNISRATKEDIVEANSQLNKYNDNLIRAVAQLNAGQILDPVAQASIEAEYPGWTTMPANRKKQALVKIQKEMIANKALVTTPVELQPTGQVVDQGKMQNYTNNLMSVMGNEMVLAIPGEAGGTYKDKNAWVGIQEALIKYAKKEGLTGKGGWKINGVKQGMSLGNPYGIPGGAVTNLIITDDSGQSLQVPMIAAPNKQLRAVTDPMNRAWSAANDGSTEPTPIYLPDYKENMMVEKYPTHENGKWELKARYKIPDAMVAETGGKKYLTFEEFSDIYTDLHRDKIEVFKNSFIQ